MSGAVSRGLQIALVAGEHSGDQLGFRLMGALRQALKGKVGFFGVGGEAMEAEGLQSEFPISDIAVMGIMPVLARLPTLIARIRQTAEAIVAARPDALVIIDSPDFTHRVARRVRKAMPDLPIVDFVSPSVWAWRPGRAKAMRAYINCVLALLPFEPQAYVRLGGPRCVYVGHPLIERLDDLRPNPDEARRRVAEPPLVVVLPGSRRSEIRRLMHDFGAALQIIRELGRTHHGCSADVAACRRRGARARGALAAGAADRARRGAEIRGVSKCARRACGVGHCHPRTRARWRADGRRLQSWPYRGAAKYLIKVPSILLPNLILGERAIPEKVQRDCTPAALGAAMTDLVRDGPQRQAQLEALARLDQFMRLPDGLTPSEKAAGVVLETIAARKSEHENLDR